MVTRLPRRVVLVTGPPCSGKTTAAARWAQAGDVVLDFDVIARELGSPALWLHPEPWRSQADARMRQAIASLPGTGDGIAFVIRSAAAATYRSRLATTMRAEACVVLDPGETVCLERAAARPAGTAAEIRSWYRVHRPWAGDVATWSRGTERTVRPSIGEALRLNPSRAW